MAQSIYTRYHGFNPYHVDVNEKTYEVKDIVFYKEDGTLIAVGRGWFGNNNRIPMLTVPKVLLRRKPNFDGETFIIPKKKDYFDRKDSHPHAHLYIPFDYFDFENRPLEENHGYYTDVYPHYYSRRNDRVEFIQYKGRTRVENESKKAYAEVLLGTINAIEAELEKLKAQYKEYDEGELLKEAHKDNPLFNHGAASEIRATIQRAKEYKTVLEKRGYPKI